MKNWVFCQNCVRQDLFYAQYKQSLVLSNWQVSVSSERKLKNAKLKRLDRTRLSSPAGKVSKFNSSELHAILMPNHHCHRLVDSIVAAPLSIYSNLSKNVLFEIKIKWNEDDWE